MNCESIIPEQLFSPSDQLKIPTYPIQEGLENAGVPHNGSVIAMIQTVLGEYARLHGRYVEQVDREVHVPAEPIRTGLERAERFLKIGGVPVAFEDPGDVVQCIQAAIGDFCKRHGAFITRDTPAASPSP